MRILIVDDDFISRRLLLKSLEGLGECEIACNGKEAWEAFQAAHAENKPYYLILLDIMMPEMDGREALRLMRGFESKQKIPNKFASKIAMATTLTDSKNIIQSFTEQCDGYITKPYTRDSLFTDLKKFSIYPPA